MKLQDLKIGQKLTLSFGLVLAIFIASTLYQMFELKKLGMLQDEGAKRSEDLVVVEEASGMGYKVYQVVADAIINRNLTESEKAWNIIKSEIVDDINNVKEVIDTQVEEEYHAEAKQVSQDLISHIENELIPLLKNEFSEENELKIREVDGEIDELVENLSIPLSKIVASLAKETKEGDEQYDSMQQNVFFISIILLVISIVISVLLVFIITRAIVRGFKNSIHIAGQISNGNLNVEIDSGFLKRKDEIGKLLNSLNNMKEKLTLIIKDIVSGADQISTASQQLSATSQQMSQGSSEQASSAEEVSSSMEQMASNIQQNTDNAQQTEKISVKASNDIGEGKDSVVQTVESMKNIANKIGIISEIARQTNILALNAAVEAARAGEHGKGFAVVAEEVRKLAARSQEAAKEIDETSKRSVTIAEKSGKLLEEIVPDIERTAKLVQEIAAASSEQTSGADQVNSAIQQLNQVTQQNAAASEEMATSSEELASQANQLKDAISYFKIE